MAERETKGGYPSADVRVSALRPFPEVLTRPAMRHGPPAPDRGAEIRAYLDAYRDAMLAALDEHGPADSPFGRFCKTCGSYFEYGVLWPCPTARVIASALNIKVHGG